MSTEELQLILTMAQQAGEGAFALACIYMLVGLFKSLLIPGVWVSFFVLVYKGGRYCIDRFLTEKATKLEILQAGILTRLNWAECHYQILVERGVKEFIKGHTNTIDGD